MAEFLAGVLAVVLIKADVFDAWVALEVENPLRREAEKMSDLIVTRIPEVPIVPRILDKHFMRSDRTHAVIKAVAAASRVAFDVVERPGMHEGTRRPGRTCGARRLGDDLQIFGRIGTEWAG